MSLSELDLKHLILALGIILISAHGLGYLFKHFRQPQVIGEVLGGLVLGPSLLGHFLPELYLLLFVENTATSKVLGAIYQLGLLLLMFCSGMEMRLNFSSGEKKTVGWMTSVGTIVPFFASFLLVQIFPLEEFIGPANNRQALILVFAIAIAVTSIPVISRIFADLKLLGTPFAKIVLTSAVIEDVALYCVLAVALRLAGSPSDEILGVKALLVFVFFGVSLWLGPKLFKTLYHLRFNLPKKSSTTAFFIIFMLLITAAATFLGINPMLGAFIAGILIHGEQDENSNRARKSIKNFSYAFFIPIYFAIVGLKIDLVRQFDVSIFLLFFLAATAIKIISVYIGCRLAGEKRSGSFNFAMAMNARGGPGIVLASVAFDAGIISSGFYSILVVLAILTSMTAGTWLERLVRKDIPLR